LGVWAASSLQTMDIHGHLLWHSQSPVSSCDFMFMMCWSFGLIKLYFSEVFIPQSLV
jgi:hypothetical protein